MHLTPTGEYITKSFHISKTDLGAAAINLVRSLSITIEYMAAVTLASAIFFHFSNNVTNISIIHALAIIMIAHTTSCYGAGILASLFGVFWVNFAFTYPYLTLNFTMFGYPVTFLSMTLISSLSSSIYIMITKQNVQLQEKNRMLPNTEKETMRANLIRAMSHDLRTPLTGIIGSGSTYLAQEGYISPEEKRKLAKNIEGDAQWLLNMAENLLSVTRIQDGENTASMVKADESLGEVISESVQRFRKWFPDVQVWVSIPGSVVIIPMDATLIEQVINSLLENTLFHSGTNGPIDPVAASEKGRLSVSIKDHGKGIASELLDTIFDGGGTSENHTGDGHKGMGIGLGTYKTIISAHGGKIHAGNHLRSTQFTFTLPDWREYQIMNTKANIIIIEDEKSICSFTETVLSPQGYRVVCTNTRTNGLKLIESLKPSVILLDLGLPGTDNLKLIQEIGSTNALPIIVTSARTLEHNKVAALDLGADGYLTKPFGTAELLAHIRATLCHSQRTADTQSPKYEVGDLLIDFERRLVKVKGQDAHLTQIEYKLVSLLAQNAGKIMTYENIISKIWGPFADSDNQTLRVNMTHIGRELEEDPAEPQYIFTEIGIGCQMCEE